MRIGFAGTPGFAAAMPEAILDAGRPVALTLAQPDRPRGRGLAIEPGPVAALARARHIPLLQPQGLKTAEARTPVTAIPLDVLVVAAYGLILPPEILAWPLHGCINVHASLLPRWRGAAPIERALLAGDEETGISIMQMDAGLDTGPVIARYPVRIGPIRKRMRHGIAGDPVNPGRGIHLHNAIDAAQVLRRDLAGSGFFSRAPSAAKPFSTSRGRPRTTRPRPRPAREDFRTSTERCLAVGRQCLRRGAGNRAQRRHRVDGHR